MTTHQERPSYVYNAASNLTRRTDPRSLVTTWNSYDSLNRPASISYSDTTPAVSFTYDSVSATNGKGRLTAMSDGAGSESYHYDSMGRVTSLTRVMTGGPTLTSNYTWTLLGSMKESAFPGIHDAVYPLTIFCDYDSAGRQKSAWWNNGSDYLQMVSSYSFNYTNTSATNYAQEITNFSNGTSETVTHDIRLQPVRRTVSPAGTLDYQTIFAKPGSGGNNGNVWAIDDLAVAGNDQDFTYDFLNRITGATGPGTRSLVFTQDCYGNKSQTGTNGAPHKPLTFTAARNRMNSTGYSYDNAGNLTAEPLDVYTGRGAMTYAYDGENRIQSTGGSGTATYSYDGLGRRVKKVSGGTTRYYFYDPAGNPVWEGKLHVTLLDTSTTSPGQLPPGYICRTDNQVWWTRGSSPATSSGTFATGGAGSGGRHLTVPTQALCGWRTTCGSCAMQTPLREPSTRATVDDDHGQEKTPQCSKLGR